MADPSQLERGLRRVLWELRSYLPDIIVIGGWVPHLYRRYGGFAEWRVVPSLTGEVDVLLPSTLDSAARPSIPAILARAGFQPVGDERRAAVWANDPTTGSKVEFFVPHTGTGRQIGAVESVAAQPGLGALSLTDLSLAQAYTATLSVPVTVTTLPVQDLTVRVPTLGAYVVTKAATYPKRTPVVAPDGGLSESPKRAKDVLYLRDIMAAGESVVDRVVADVEEIRRGEVWERDYLRYASNNVGLLLGKRPSQFLREAAQMLAERDRLTTSQASQDVAGFMTDLAEILAG